MFSKNSPGGRTTTKAFVGWLEDITESTAWRIKIDMIKTNMAKLSANAFVSA